MIDYKEANGQIKIEGLLVAHRLENGCLVLSIRKESGELSSLNVRDEIRECYQHIRELELDILHRKLAAEIPPILPECRFASLLNDMQKPPKFPTLNHLERALQQIKEIKRTLTDIAEHERAGEPIDRFFTSRPVSRRQRKKSDVPPSVLRQSEFVRGYVAACEVYKVPNPSLSQIAEYLGWVQGTISKELCKPRVLVEILDVLRHKARCAKTNERREFWATAVVAVEQKGSALTMKIQKSRERPQFGDPLGDSPDDDSA